MCLIDFYYSYSDKGYILNLIKDRRVCNKLKYGNEINSIEFFDFTAQDFNLFFTICWHIKQKKSKKILNLVIPKKCKVRMKNPKDNG